jgi:hypothetical protein
MLSEAGRADARHAIAATTTRIILEVQRARREEAARLRADI